MATRDPGIYSLCWCEKRPLAAVGRRCAVFVFGESWTRLLSSRDGGNDFDDKETTAPQSAFEGFLHG